MAEKQNFNDCDWELASGFDDSWQKFKTDALKKAMTAFNERKRSIPPQPLPRSMNDHKLTGSLKDYWECHLEGDVLLIYKPLPGGAIKLFRVCTHDDIRGPRGEGFSRSAR
jgi:addiction module RelE/StbE family toxin